MDELAHSLPNFPRAEKHSDYSFFGKEHETYPERNMLICLSQTTAKETSAGWPFGTGNIYIVWYVPHGPVLESG